MRKTINWSMMVIGLGLVVPQTARSQGTVTYLTSLGQPSVGSGAVGSDSWLAEWFLTGNNPGGYELDSIELAMASASDTPSAFTVELCSANVGFAVYPGSILGTLSGSADPETAGAFTYTASGLTLSPSTSYFILLTAETAVSSGAYAWSFGNSLASSSGGWSGSSLTTSDDQGTQWTFSSSFPEYSLTATAVPEPCPLTMLGLASMVFFGWRCLQAKAQIAQGKFI